MTPRPPLPEVPVRTMGAGPVLVFAPHADDEVFGCGGAILRHRQEGTAVSVVVVTDGAFGESGERRAEVTAVRQAESRRAATVLGCEEPRFWTWRDGEVRFSEALVCAVLEEMERTGARLVYAPSTHELHADHRAIGRACLEAARRLERPLQVALYEVSGPLTPTHLLDLTELLARKQEAIACFASQLAQRPYDRQVVALNQYRTFTLPSAVVAAEAFEVIDNAALRAPSSAGSRAHALEPPPSTAGLAEPLISVVVRSTNRSTLREALDSLEAQTYEAVEVVLVDVRGQGLPPPPCSRPLRVVGTGRPLGRSAAAQLGLDEARGRWVAFLDDDDYLYPDHLSALAGALRDERLGRVAYAGVECVQRVGDQRTRVQTFNSPFNPLRLLYENYIPINALLFERALAAEGCAFDPALDLYEDWDFLLQLSGRTPFQHLDRVTAAYRFPPGTSVGRPDPTRADTTAFEEIIDKWSTRWTRAQLSDLMRALRGDRLPRVQELQGALQQGVTQVHQLTLRAEQAERAVVESRAHEEQLRGRAEQAERAVVELRAEAEQLRGRAEQAEREVVESRAHEAQLQVRAEQAERAMVELRADAEQLRAWAERSDHAQAEQRAQVGRLGARVEQAECALAEARAELLRVREELQQREDRVDALLGSRSWRWMAPLRAGLDLVTRR